MNAAALSPLFREVINHLWQSTIFALAAALLTLAFRKNRAHVRYWIWLSASLKFLVPFALLMSLGGSAWNELAAKKMVASIAAPSVSLTVAQVAQPFSETQSFSSAASATTHSVNWLLIIGSVLWACGFFAVGLMRLRGWLRVRAALRASKPIDVASQQSFDRHSEGCEAARRTPLHVSSRTAPGLLEPGVVGIFRQTLLLSEGILQNLTPPQLESVLAHELAHIRRRDNLTAAIHMLVEAVFWSYPPVWWIGARLVEERERACDESVLSCGNAPRDYAEAILGVCKLYVESPLACVSGVTGADLKKRIHEILSGHVSDELKLAKKAALAIVAAAALAMPIFIGAINASATRAQSVSGALPSFDVVSIKPDPDPTHFSGHSIHIHENNGYYDATGLTAKYLIKDAYNLTSDDQLSGGPDWISSEPYAIQAKFDPAREAKWTHLQKQVQMRLMIQSLLADRFQLKVSHQTKELPVFNLVVAKGGPKIGPPTGNADQQANDGHNEGDVEISTLRNEPIQSLIDDLSRQPEIGGRLVIDKTGLTGYYTFNWKWTRQIDNIDPSANGSASSDPPSLWTALQEQLGLRLESAKGPVDTIVIDSIERPAPN